MIHSVGHEVTVESSNGRVVRGTIVKIALSGALIVRHVWNGNEWEDYFRPDRVLANHTRAAQGLGNFYGL